MRDLHIQIQPEHEYSVALVDCKERFRTKQVSIEGEDGTETKAFQVDYMTGEGKWDCDDEGAYADFPSAVQDLIARVIDELTECLADDS